MADEPSSRPAADARIILAMGIGVVAIAVIVVVSLGSSASRGGADAASDAAPREDLAVLVVRAPSRSDDAPGASAGPTLRWSDAERIGREVADARAVAPLARKSRALATDDANWTTRVGGTTADYFAVRRWTAARGRLFGSDGADVVVLGQTVAHQLYGERAPIGQWLRIGSSPFEVIGVLSPRGATELGEDQDDAVFVPAPAYLRKVAGGPADLLDGVVWVLVPASATERATAAITAVLRDAHRLGPSQPDDFRIGVLPER